MIVLTNSIIVLNTSIIVLTVPVVRRHAGEVSGMVPSISCTPARSASTD